MQMIVSLKIEVKHRLLVKHLLSKMIKNVN